MSKIFFCLIGYLEKKEKKFLYLLTLLNISYPCIDILIISIIIPIIIKSITYFSKRSCI